VGSIAKLGTRYVIGLIALNCNTGDGLTSEQVEGDSREHVLKALGESLVSVQKYDVELEQATTTSLEALKAYSLGTATALFPLIRCFRRPRTVEPPDCNRSLFAQVFANGLRHLEHIQSGFPKDWF
jgi:hypothetical protein